MFQSSLKGRFISGARWTLAVRVVDRGLGFFSTLLLARLLTPEDFGVIAMGTSILAVLMAITEFGFAQALIQREDTAREAYDTAWTLQIIASAIVALLVVSIIPVALHWYGEPRVVPVMLVLAGVAFASSFRNVGLVLFEREMDFRPMFFTVLGRKIASVTVAVGTAVVLGNHWALLAGMVAGTIVDIVLSYRVSPFRPRLSLERTHELIGFSKWWLAAQFLELATRRGQDFFLGARLGAERLGQYTVAFELATLPTTEIVAAVSRALLPGYMKLKHDPEQMFAAFARVWAVVALITLPAAAGIYALAGPITLVVLGQKWAGTEALLELLAFLGVLHAMGNTLWPLVLARGGAKAVFLLRLLGFILALPAFAVLLALFGLQVAVLGLLATSLIWLVVGAVWLSGFGLSEMKRLAGALVRPMSASAAMVGLLYLSRQYFVSEGGWGSFAGSLIANVALGAAVYAITLSALWWVSGRPTGAERDLVSMIPMPFNSMRRRKTT